MVLFFKHAEETSEEDLQKLAEHEQIIIKAYEELDRYSWNEEELLTYDQAEKYEAAYRASLEQKFEEGEKIGIEKGEKMALLRVAKNLLEQGLTVHDIQQITGLAEKDISAFQK